MMSSKFIEKTIKKWKIKLFIKKSVFGQPILKVIDEFGKHTLEEHGIDYGKESLMQFVLRKD